MNGKYEKIPRISLQKRNHFPRSIRYVSCETLRLKNKLQRWSLFFDFLAVFSYTFLMKTKQEIRNDIYSLLLTQEKDSIQEQQAHISEKIYHYIREKKLQDICIYIGTDGEIDTLPLIELLLKEHKNIYIPKVLSQTEMQIIQIHNIHDLVE